MKSLSKMEILPILFFKGKHYVEEIEYPEKVYSIEEVLKLYNQGEGMMV